MENILCLKKKAAHYFRSARETSASCDSKSLAYPFFLFSRLKFRFRNSIELEANKLLEKLLSHIDLSDEIMPRKLMQAALGEC